MDYLPYWRTNYIMVTPFYTILFRVDLAQCLIFRAKVGVCGKDGIKMLDYFAYDEVGRGIIMWGFTTPSTIFQFY